MTKAVSMSRLFQCQGCFNVKAVSMSLCTGRRASPTLSSCGLLAHASFRLRMALGFVGFLALRFLHCFGKCRHPCANPNIPCSDDDRSSLTAVKLANCLQDQGSAEGPHSRSKNHCGLLAHWLAHKPAFPVVTYHVILCFIGNRLSRSNRFGTTDRRGFAASATAHCEQ